MIISFLTPLKDKNREVFTVFYDQRGYNCESSFKKEAKI